MDFNTCFETTNEVRALALYAHLLPITVSIVLGFFTYRYAKNRTKALFFFSFTLLLSLWLTGNLITWTSDNYFVVAAFWSTLDYINILFYLFILCFALVDFSGKQRLLTPAFFFLAATALFPLILTVGGLSVHEFDLPNCEMYGNEVLAQYKLILEWIVIFSIIVTSLFYIFKSWTNKPEVKRLAVSTFAIVSFLAIFSSSEYIATVTDVYEINLYALFILPIFLLLLVYTIIEQGTFKFKVESIWFVRILVLFVILLGLSSLLLTETKVQFLVTLASTITTFGFGLLVLRSASKEASQRKEIEQLAEKLKEANSRLKELDQMKSEFVSIASHQLRSPLTSIRGYASMLLEGSYGKLPIKAVAAVERISDSSTYMASSIEDYLNVSRIEAGNMKYEISDFNLKNEAECVADDKRQEAMKKGLLVTFKSDLDQQGIVNADIGKTRQIIHNLLNNAIKYTPRGTITVFVHDDKKIKKIYVDIIDSGIGMRTDELEDIFGKFERAHNANQTNVTGTGLGLFVAKKMARGMNGDVTAYSDGVGHGSTFRFEMPLQM